MLPWAEMKENNGGGYGHGFCVDCVLVTVSLSDPTTDVVVEVVVELFESVTFALAIFSREYHVIHKQVATATDKRLVMERVYITELRSFTSLTDRRSTGRHVVHLLTAAVAGEW